MSKCIKFFFYGLITIGMIFSIGGGASAAEYVDVELTKLDGSKMTRKYEKPRYGGTITMNREILLVDFENWDPRGGGGPHELANTYITNNRLTQLDWARGASGTNEYPNFVAADPPLYQAPMLAHKWEYTSDLTMVFHMRDDIYFWKKEDVVKPNPALEAHYGRKVTAHDAVWSKNNGNFYQAGQPGTITWTALDDHTLQLSWAKPDALHTGWKFSSYTEIFSAGMENVPKDDWGNWHNNLGTGSYIPTDFVKGSSLTYKRNPNYWEMDPIHTNNRLPYIDTLRIVNFDDEATIIAALRAGQIDMTSGLGLAGKFGLQLKKTNPEIGQFPAASTPAVWVPRVDLKDNPFSDIKVRQALMMSIPREQIVEAIYGGFAAPYSYPTFPNFSDWFVKYEELPTEPTLPGSCASAKDVVTHNPEKARECLAAAGYPDGFEFDLVSPPGEAEFNEMYQGIWNKVGIRANLKVVELAVWQSTKDRMDHLGLTSWTPGIWQDPFVALYTKLASTANINSARVKDSLYDDILPIVQTELDNEKRIAAYREFFPKALEDSVYMHGVSFDKLNFWHPWVKGYSGEISSAGIQGWHCPAKYSWIDQDMQQQ